MFPNYTGEHEVVFYSGYNQSREIVRTSLGRAMASFFADRVEADERMSRGIRAMNGVKSAKRLKRQRTTVV